jgi:8-oxo-dGTP pyrophosphatase MutT (NUDIX family)
MQKGPVTFHEVVTCLLERLQHPLPGQAAHEVMRAHPASGAFPDFGHKVPPKPGSVLILIYPDEYGNAVFPLIKRPDYIGAHSGQVSLPGGKMEPGEDHVATALREAWEEIGVDVSEPRVIGRLTEFFVIPSNFLVVPVIATVQKRPQFIPHTREVSRIIEASVTDILAENAILQREILAAGQYRLIAPHFEIDGEVVWGATAMMLNELRTCLKEVRA